MTSLPIVTRELRVAARLPSTSRNRTLAAGAVMGTAFAMYVFGIFAKAQSQAGIYMFKTLSFVAVVFCAVEGMRKTADCLSSEKREGTLGLLFLTDLKSYDVVMGKFVGASLNSIYGLLGILPVLALPLIVGGVMFGEYFRMVLALLNTMFFSLCAGTLVSAKCHRQGAALSGTFFLVLAVMLVPVFVPINSIACFSPATAFKNAFAAAYAGHAILFWLSLALTQTLSWLMLLAACVGLPFWWQEIPVEKKTYRPILRGLFPRSGKETAGASLRRQLLAINPALWLAARDSGAGSYPWLMTFTAAVGGLVCILLSHIMALLVFFAIINTIFQVRVAYQACRCLAEARQNNALEMLLTSPLTVKEIIEGQVVALRRIILPPMVYLIIVEFLEVFFGLAIHGGTNAASAGWAVMVVYFGLFGLNIVAVTWAGMWFGLTARQQSHAATKTVVLVLILPFLSFFGLRWFGAICFIVIPVFWIVWCSGRLKTRFRAAAARCYSTPADDSRWLSMADKPSVPPIIAAPAQ